MKKRNFSKIYSIAAVAVLISLSSCGSLENLGKNFYTVSPDPLEVHGGKVTIDISADFPKETFPKSAAVEVTPVLKFEGGEEAFEAATYQGDEYPNNFETVSYATGGAVSYNGEIDYKEELNNSELELRLTGKEGQTEQVFAPIVLAKGVITTSLLVEEDEKPVMTENAFERITEEQMEAKINFSKNSSVVKNKELRDNDYKEIKDFLKLSLESENIELVAINLLGYASPEGELSLNENLSSDRAAATVRLLKREMRRLKFARDVYNGEGLFESKALGADWDGLNVLLSENDALSQADKGTIQRALDGTPLMEEKEKTLKNLTTTYNVLENDILPALRRTKFVIKYKLVGKTDEQLMTMAVSEEASTLSAEELLYAASLLENSEDKITALSKGVEMFEDDYRFATNLGYEQFMAEDLEAASASFEKAFTVEENDITKTNLALSKKRGGDLESASDLLKGISNEQGKYNRGVLLLQQGKYTQAVKSMSGFNTLNFALAKVLRSDYTGALKTLEETKDESAKADYLRAIASIRIDKVDDAKAYIESASSKDDSYKGKAETDLEFRKIYAPAQPEATE